LHIEGQGYRDTDFSDRLFYYHLGHVLRYRPRRVRTLALWLTRPSYEQRRGVIERGDVTVRVKNVVLSEIPAELLLEHSDTACFAAGANAGPMTDEELCEQVARRLVEGKVSLLQQHMAVIAAISQKRYRAMVAAMEHANLGPVIIEDLVKFGEDIGFEKG